MYIYTIQFGDDNGICIDSDYEYLLIHEKRFSRDEFHSHLVESFYKVNEINRMVRLANKELEVGVTLDDLAQKMTELFNYVEVKRQLMFNGEPYTYRDNNMGKKIGLYIQNENSPIIIESIKYM